MSKHPQHQAVVNHARTDMANLLPQAATPSPETTAQGRKLGEGHAKAMLRLGAHELTQILAAFPDSNVKPIEEPGVVGNPTPQVITKQIDRTEPTVSDSAHRAQFQNKDQSRGIER